MGSDKERISRIVGLGADEGDGHLRFTTGEGYDLLSGSEQSHELMQRWCAEIERRLKAMNKDMSQLSIEEFLIIAREAAPRS